MALSLQAQASQDGPSTANNTKNTQATQIRQDAIEDDIGNESDSNESDPHDLEATERRNVRLEVQNLIAPWRESSVKPPFMAAELVVIACLLSEYTLVKTDILSSLLHLFSYYRTKAIDQYAYVLVTGGDGGAPDPDAVIDGFQRAFDLWDTPLVDHEGEELVRWSFDGSDMVAIDVPPRAGRVFLRHLLEPERKGCFPFLKLPAEIRNAIYSMVFTMPGAVVRVDKLIRKSTCQLYAKRRFEDKQQEPSEYENDRVDIDPVSVLAPLLTNKQIYAEAMPFFHGLNRFSCKWLRDLQHMLNCVPTARMKQIRHLDFQLVIVNDDQYRDFEALMKKLRTVEKLHTLKVLVWESQLLKIAKRVRGTLGRTRQFTNYRQIDGFGDLAVVCSKADELTVLDLGGGAFKPWIEAEVKKIKDVEAKAVLRRSGRKRKAVADTANDGKGNQEGSSKKANRG